MLPLNLPKQVHTSSKLINKQLNLPPNLAGTIPVEIQKEIFKDIYQSFIFPQIQERKPYEAIWDKLLDMYRINIDRRHLRFGSDDEKLKDRNTDRAEGSEKADVSDSLMFDAVDRLKNLNHFISWKDGPPVQYSLSKYYQSSKENEFYHPLADKIQSANGLLEWNCSQQDVYRKHLITAGHHYLYGCSFVNSEFEYEKRLEQTRNGAEERLYRCGVTFEPISIRKLWINYRATTYDMDKQPCPFFYEEMPRFQALANQYNKDSNPFGFVNLDKLQSPQYLFTQEEVTSFRTAIESRLNTGKGVNEISLGDLLSPEFSMEAIWTFYPMLPLDPNTGDYKQPGQKLERFIVQVFASSLKLGEIVPIRIQKLFYPKNRLPIYASCHIPDMDSGAYGLSIGEVLMGYYEQICTCINQWLDNKNLINNPPSWRVTGSPAAAQDYNKPGGVADVHGPNDIGWRTVYDGTHATVPMLEWMRDRAQTTSKAVDAILGKALGGRTSATEAQNVFQSAMSGVTTDINLFNYDIMAAGYALRVWEISGLFFDEDLIKLITGQYGQALTIEDLQSDISLKWDVGSSYIESITKQQHIRYVLESASRSPNLRQDILWREFFQEIKLPSLQKAVIDNGFAEEVSRATEQAIQTYLGEVTMVSPDQNHDVAIKVKTKFLEDKDSGWNQTYGNMESPVPSLMNAQPVTRAQSLVEQIQVHQQLLIQQMQMEATMMQQQQQQQNAQQQTKSSPEVAEKPGQIRQQYGQ